MDRLRRGYCGMEGVMTVQDHHGGKGLQETEQV